MPRVLIIDDDPELLEVLGLAFEDEGYTVVRAVDGREGLKAIASEKPDIIVSDVTMPRLDGFSLCRQLRERGDETPLVLLTSRDGEIDEALGRELGADDYVSKPFSTRVLLARMAALLRRQAARTGARGEGPRSVGPLELDAERLEVRWRGAPLTTTVTEFRLLEILTERPGVVLSRSAILERLRGDTMVADRIIDTYVRRLRRGLQAIDPEFDAIETVVGAGYRWKS